MTRTKKILGLILLGVVLGFLFVPRAAFVGALWSVVERRAADNGLVLNCSSPNLQFFGAVGLLSLDAESCIVRYQAFGAELSAVNFGVVGVFPPRVSITSDLFGHRCELEATSSGMTVRNCGITVTRVPQLVGFGFTAGTISMTGKVSLHPKFANSASGTITVRGLNHPKLSMNRLGFGPRAHTVLIPEFNNGELDATFMVNNSEEAQITIQKLSSSLGDGQNGLVRATLAGRDRSQDELSGELDFTLSPSGAQQFGPLIESIAELGEDTGDRPLRTGYRLRMGGSLKSPSFRVLKSSDPR